ncbi:hypothetical protein [Spirosoma areae]
MRKLIGVLGLLLLTAQGYSTTIVIYPTNKHIYIGADSRRVEYMTYPGTDVVFNKTTNAFCKIRVYKNYAFAVAGFDDQGMHDVIQAIATGNYNSTNLFLATLEKGLRFHLVQKVEEFRLKYPNKYKAHFKNDTENKVAEIAVCYFQNNVPIVRIIEFTKSHKPNGQSMVGSQAYVIESVYVVGIQKKIRQSYTQAQALALFKEGNDKLNVMSMQKLINLQSSATPESVGGKVDVLKLDITTKPKWLIKKVNCI